VLAQARRLVAVEERALLGVDQPRAVAFGLELRRRVRDRDADLVQPPLYHCDLASGSAQAAKVRSGAAA
jgi:hypothetical protein